MNPTPLLPSHEGLVIDRHGFSAPDGQPLVMERFRTPEQLARQGVPVVLVHGLGQNRYSWYSSKTSLVRHLAARGFDVFVLELRGHGLSRDAGSVCPESFSDYVKKDMHSVLDEIQRLTGGRKPFFCGHSLGGTIGYALEDCCSSRVAGMILLASPLYFARGLRVLTFFCRAFTTAYQCYTPVRAWDILDKKRAFPVWLYGRALKISLPLQDWERNPFPYKAWYPGSFDRDVLQERLSLGFDRTSLELMKFMVMWAGLGKLPDAGEHKVVENNLSRFEMPALFLGGMEDCLVPQESMRPAYDLMASSDKTWLMLGGEGSRVHWGHLDLILGREAPRRVWPLMTRWMLDRA